MFPGDLEEVIYFVSYVVLDPGATTLIKKQTLSDKEYRAYYEKYGNTFKVGMGAESIRELLMAVDLDKESEDCKRTVNESSASQKGPGQKAIKAIKKAEKVSYTQAKELYEAREAEAAAAKAAEEAAAAEAAAWSADCCVTPAETFRSWQHTTRTRLSANGQ